MALTIRNKLAEELAEEVAQLCGETKTQVVTVALQERLDRLKKKATSKSLSEELLEIGRQCAALPILDHGSPDEILGYDERGLPT